MRPVQRIYVWIGSVHGGPTSQGRVRGSGEARRTTAIVSLLLGTVVAVVLGVYAHAHPVTGRAPLSLGFDLAGQMKVWFTRVAAVLALFQLASGLRINGHIRVPRRIPRWFRIAHRTSGLLAVLLAAAVAYDCVSAFGFQIGSARLTLHGTVGLVFFGAFAAKVVAWAGRSRSTRSGSGPSFRFGAGQDRAPAGPSVASPWPQCLSM